MGPSAPVTIPDAGFNIAGYIDRLDISGDGKRALVRDYKTGQAAQGDIRLDGGKELQRCLYAFAVKALLGTTSRSAHRSSIRESRSICGSAIPRPCWQRSPPICARRHQPLRRRGHAWPGHGRRL